MREVDQGLDDGGGVAVGADGVDEHLIDLDDVDAELEHVGQPAVTGAGADVVDGDAHAEPLEGGDDLTGFGEVFDRVALGQFQHDLRQLDRRAGEDIAHIFHARVAAEQLAGEIE
ncbi:MAG: hypothetical protein EXR03_10650 [Pseudolabrys sp.]|nr:hypothetical protein [Pseudolabrys sp.]